MTTFEVYKLVHVLAAIAWVGGSFMLFFLDRMLASRGDHEAIGAIGRLGQKLGLLYFMPAAVITLVFGILMVLDADHLSFSDPFISIGFAGLVASAAIGGAGIGRASEQLATVVAAEGPAAPGAVALQQRIHLLSLVNLAVLVVTVWAMVAQP